MILRGFCMIVISAFIACQQSSPVAPTSSRDSTAQENVIACPPGGKLNIAEIEKITGMKGVEKNGEYKITVPQNDLKVVVDGFKIIPPMGLGSWTAFTPCGDSAMVMGDIILSETDLKRVQQVAIGQGFAITGIHNHFLRNRPNVMYMHIDKSGDITSLASGVKAIFAKVAETRGADPKSAKADSVVSSLNLAQLDSIVGTKGELNKGVYKQTIGRPDVALMEHGIPISSFMGFNTWAAWQGTPEKAAVAGDFAMLEDEVEPVIKTLVENNIEVVAVHNHMVHEKPHIFFLHYWGVGPAEDLAKGIKAALNQTGKNQESHM